MGQNREISPQEFTDLSYQLAKKIHWGGIDAIVCIATGGLSLGKIIADESGLQLLSIAARIYEKNRTNRVKLEIGTMSYLEPPEGRILLVDDLSDSGTTFKGVSKHLLNDPNISQVKTAAIFIKKGTCFVPDYYIEETDKWIDFYYERREIERREMQTKVH